MRCLVTAGPTFEPLDHVRRLTNFSTGSLGGELAAALCRAGHEVLLLRGIMSTSQPPRPRPRLTIQAFSTTADLASRFRTARTWKPDVLFHAAAVSDFGTGQVFERASDGTLQPVKSGKFSTRGPALLVELVPTRKIIASLRRWFPQARIVGWKYEVDGSRTDAVQRGLDQLSHCRTDAVVVNGKAYGDGFGFATPQHPLIDLPDRKSLYRHLVKWSG